MIIVDGEMSGINPKKSSLVSLGAVDFENPKYQFYEECRVWEDEGFEIDPESLAVNGFTEAEVRDPNKQSVVELAKNFYGWVELIKDKTISQKDH